MSAVVDKEKCTACGECVSACPLEVITIEEDKACIDPDGCSECGACVDTCPVVAIAL